MSPFPPIDITQGALSEVEGARGTTGGCHYYIFFYSTYRFTNYFTNVGLKKGLWP